MNTGPRYPHLITDLPALCRAIATELREHPENWAQGALARDQDGNPVDSAFSERASCWCSIGLIDRETMPPGSPCYHESDVLERTYRKLRGSIAEWQDQPDRTVDEVAGTFEEMAVRLETAS